MLRGGPGGVNWVCGIGERRAKMGGGMGDGLCFGGTLGLRGFGLVVEGVLMPFCKDKCIQVLYQERNLGKTLDFKSGASNRRRLSSTLVLRDHRPFLDKQEAFPSFADIMSLIFRRGVASMASLKKASKVVCIGRNYAYVPP